MKILMKLLKAVYKTALAIFIVGLIFYATGQSCKQQALDNGGRVWHKIACQVVFDNLRLARKKPGGFNEFEVDEAQQKLKAYKCVRDKHGEVGYEH